MTQLQQLLAKEDTVIFVGSGVSRWAGLPSWEGMVNSLADYLADHGSDASLVRQEAKFGDLLQAASYGITKLSKPQFGEFIRSVCATGAAEPVAIYEALMKLGPSCFITTNYDDLIEQAFRRWRPAPREPKIVLNRQPVEQADIVQATTRNFVFKPHGDARDIETIVLTREQYRMLMPEGSFSATLTTLRTLLSSRPILFVGFGLRDPDFLYIRDLLANIYRGGMRDHYAIVADPVRDQIDWWRDACGVHLIGYETRARADGSRDHNALMELLVAAGQIPAMTSSSPTATFDLADPALVLELARYAASSISPDTVKRFNIRVSAENRSRSSSQFAQVDPYDYWSAERLLFDGPKRLVLTGAPGAGKSFAIRHAVNEFASALQDACLRGNLTKLTRVPMLVDLKLYEGDLVTQINKRFPPKLDLIRLSDVFPVTLFFDGFNELPRDQRESGTFNTDLDALLAAHPNLDVVIGSRTSDGLVRLGLPIYELSDIAEDDVRQLLIARDCIIPDAHRRDIEDILRRPFYFRMFEQATISLDDVQSPADLYAQYIGNLSRRFAAHFGNKINLVDALEQQAYSALELGSEAFQLEELSVGIRTVAPELEATDTDEIINWLVTVELLIALGGQRGAFVHQSVTEYLAARKLAVRLADKRSPISDLIVLRRWDNVIFLTLSMLDSQAARALLEQIIDVDLDFAIEAARFVEEQRDALLEVLLGVLLVHPRLKVDDHNVSRFHLLQFTKRHEALLRRVAKELPSLRSTAVHILARILGQAYKPELIDMLFGEEYGWTVRQSVRVLGPLLEQSDIAFLIDRALEWDPASLMEETGETHERIDALAEALAGTPPDVIESGIFARISDVELPQKRLLAALIASIAVDDKFNGAVTMLIRLTNARLLPHLFALYLNVKYEKSQRVIFIEQFDATLLDAVFCYVCEGDKWAVDLLRAACTDSPEVAKLVVDTARTKIGKQRHVLEFCATGSEGPIFAWLEELSVVAAGIDFAQEFNTIDFTELDWTGRQDLLMTLLRHRDPTLALLLMGGSIPVEIVGLDPLDLGDAQPWLGWMIELLEAKDDANAESGKSLNLRWLADQLAFLIARSSAPTSKTQLLDLLEHGDDRMRWAVGHMVMHYMQGLTTDDLTDAAITALIQLIYTQRYNEFRPHAFGYIANEAFVRDKLLPMAATGDAKARANIAGIAEAVGKRLGLRFVLPPAEDCISM